MLRKYSTMKRNPHCITPLYTHIWIIVFTYGAEPTIPIWMISLFYRTRSFESLMAFPREQTLDIYTASRVFCMWIACIITILGYSCTNTLTVCFLKCLIVSFTKWKIHIHIVLVNPHKTSTCELLKYYTIVLLVHLKDNLKHYSQPHELVFSIKSSPH